MSETSKPPYQVTLRSISEFLLQPDPLWLFNEFLPLGELAFIYGPPESFKSFAALAVGGCATKGESFGGSRIQSSGPCIYLAAEGVRGAKQRIGSLIKEGRFNPTGSLVDTSGVQFHESRERNNFIAQLLDLEHKPKLLIIDTFARHGMGLDENSSRDSGLWAGCVEKVINRVGTSALVVHHPGKDIDRGMRGSSALLGAASTVIRAERQGSVLTLLCDKQKDYDHFPALSFNFRKCHGSAVLDYDPIGLHLTEDEQIILDALRNTSVQNGLGRSDFVRRDGKQIPNASFYRSEDRLISNHLIIKLDRGRWKVNGVEFTNFPQVSK